MPIEVRRLAGALAAEVRGADLSRPLDAADRRAVREAFLAHQVLLFSEQRLDAAAQVAFTETFGPVEPLYQLLDRPQFHYRHRWRVGDGLLWDNRCALHYAVRDYGPEDVRLMQRTTAAGDRPR